MDNTFNDMHIYNGPDKQTFIYRQIRIKQIVFEKDMIYISYKDYNGVDVTMKLSKENHRSIIIE